MYISGLGIVFNRGRGVEVLEKTLTQGWQEPVSQDGVLGYRVDAEILKDKVTSGTLRRADKFTKMAVLAANDALADSGLDSSIDKNRLGIIAGTYFGPHVTTFHFLDEILNYGHKDVSVIAFSHSVHNAAAFYVSLSLSSRGPTLTLTDFFFPFQSALVTARMWLNQGRCDHVLVGYIEETGKVMEYVCSQKLNLASDGKMRPLDFSYRPGAVPGEAAVFFLLSNQPVGKKYSKIENIDFSVNPEISADLLIVDADGSISDESCYKKVLRPNQFLAGYSALAGTFAGGCAFNLAAAALSMKNQNIYPVPFVNIQSGQADIKHLSCLHYDCGGKPAVINLARI